MNKRIGFFGCFFAFAFGVACAKFRGAQGVAQCPDLVTTESLTKVDLAKEFGLQAAASTKLKSGLLAASELKVLADKIDEDLQAACITITRDLGAKAAYKSGGAACKAAIKALEEARGQLGANTKVAIRVRAPKCTASLAAMAECGGQCDASVEGGRAEVECQSGELSGLCDSQCTGTCEMTAAAKCDGTCNGHCEGQFSGTCEGKCQGKCDGKSSRGAACAGKCDGKCDGETNGRCKGGCKGECTFKASGACEGTCTGTCSIEFKEPHCTGEVQAPKVSGECNARCQTQAAANLSCSPALAEVSIEGAADAEAAENYRTALQDSLPALMRIGLGMKNHSEVALKSVSAVIRGIQKTAKAKSGARLAACLAGPIKGALATAGQLKANLDVSIDVQATISAEAGGQANAGEQTK